MLQEFLSNAEAQRHTQHDFFRKAARQSRCPTRGFLTYTIRKTCLTTPMEFDGSASYERILQQMELATSPDGTPLMEFIDECRQELDPDGKFVTPIWLGAGISAMIMKNHCDILHIIPLSLRTPRAISLTSAPSQFLIKKFLEHVGIEDPNVAQHRQSLLERERGNNVLGAIPARKMIKLVRATSNLRDMKKITITASHFASLFSDGGPETEEQMVERFGENNRETIRQGRVRLDYLAMLLFRRFLRMVMGPSVDFQIFADSSPQRRGLELFSASFDMFYDGSFQRRYFPFVNASLGFSANAKLCTLLWQIFLLVGPSFLALRAFCNQVRSIVTDMGAERLFTQASDILPQFCSMIGVAITGSFTQSRLFPRALQIGGWRHLWDVVLRRALCSLAFFPEWLLDFKAISRHTHTHTPKRKSE